MFRRAGSQSGLHASKSWTAKLEVSQSLRFSKASYMLRKAGLAGNKRQRFPNFSSN